MPVCGAGCTSEYAEEQVRGVVRDAGARLGNGIGERAIHIHCDSLIGRGGSVIDHGDVIPGVLFKRAWRRNVVAGVDTGKQLVACPEEH